MAEYIEREALLKEIDERISNLAFCSPYQNETHVVIEGMERARDSVEDAPAADVAPVVHGRWARYPNTTLTRRFCSCCEWDGSEWVQFYAYCPRCGARMDGE